MGELLPAENLITKLVLLHLGEYSFSTLRHSILPLHMILLYTLRLSFNQLLNLLIESFVYVYAILRLIYALSYIEQLLDALKYLFVLIDERLTLDGS